jgi:TrmH family RNA methyltransferase
MISSTKNPKVQWIRRLQSKGKERQAEQAFVVEGVRLLEEVLDSLWQVKFLVYTDDLGKRGLHLIQAYQAQGIQVEMVSMHVMQAISDSKNPQGILAVIEIQAVRVPDQLDFVLILDQIREPGNLGTILRSAAAAGVQVVFLVPGTVDPFSPKVVRAGMGAHFKLPVRVSNWDEIKSQINYSNLHTYLGLVDSGEVYHQTDFRRPLALIIGGEAEGASQTAHKVSDSLIHIPMPGGGESLNASVSAGILLFEIARQREMQS